MSLHSLLAAMLLLACSDPQHGPLAESSETPAPNQRAEQLPSEPAARSAAAPRFAVPAPPPAPTDSSLPAITRGRPIRIESTLEIGTRDAEGRTVPTVAHPDARARAAFDAALDSILDRCRVELALERLISVACTPGNAAPNGSLYTIANGEITPVEVLSLFHEGVDGTELPRRLQFDPEGGVHPLVVTETGMELHYDSERVARFPWRTLAPLLRADSAIGEALTAREIPLAPAGARFPPTPPQTVGIWADDPSALLDAWWRLPDDALRAAARLVGAGGRSGFALVFPPGTPAPRIASNVTGSVRVRPAYWVEPMAELVIARAREPIEVGPSPGTRTRVTWRRPAGTIVTAVRGIVDRTDSDIARGHWTYVRVGSRRNGWVFGGSLVLAEAPCRFDRPDANIDDAACEHGVFEASGARYAWLVDNWEGSHALSIHSLSECTLGEMRHRLQGNGHLSDLYVVSTEPDGGRALIAARHGLSPASVVVLDPTRDAPLLEIPRVSAIDVALQRGPDRAPGYFPLRVTTSAGQTWYRWTGDALEAITH